MSIYNLLTTEVLFLVQSPDFVSKAIDIAVKELIAVATPGEGLPLY